MHAHYSSAIKPDKALVDKNTFVILGIFAVLIIGYVINAIDRTSFPVFISDIMHEYGFGLSDAGFISTISYLGMGLTGFPVGYLLHRYSKKHMFNIGLFIFSAGTLLTIWSVQYWDMTVYRVLSGIGESLQLTALFAIAGVLFSRYRGAAMGAINSAFAIGSFVGPYLGGVMLEASEGWRVPMVVFAMVGFVAFIGTMFLPKRIIDRELHTEDESAKVVGGADSLWNHNTYLLIPATALGGLVTFGFLGMYPTFLREDLGYEALSAGFIFSLSGLGSLASLVGGYLGDWFNMRWVLVLSNVATAVIGFLMFLGPTDPISQGIFSFALGVTFSGVVYVNLVSGFVKSLNQRLSGLASGLFMTSMYVPAAFAGYIIGTMATSWGWAAAGSIQTGAFSVLAAIFCLFLKPERFSRHRVEAVAESTLSSNSH